MKFAKAKSNDFGYALSDSSLRKIDKIVDQISDNIVIDLETLAHQIQNNYNDRETKFTDFEEYQNYLQLHHKAWSDFRVNHRETKNPMLFLEQILATVANLNMDLVFDSVKPIIEKCNYLKFFKLVSDEKGITTKELEAIQSFPIAFVEIINNLYASIDWYTFCLRLKVFLAHYNIQRNLDRLTASKNLNTTENIQLFMDQLENIGSKNSEPNMLNLLKVGKAKQNAFYNLIDFSLHKGLTIERNQTHINVTGNFIKLSEIVNKLENENIKFVEIFAIDTIYIDAIYIDAEINLVIRYASLFLHQHGKYSETNIST